MTVSEGFQLHPEQTTDAIVCHHPEAKYFVACRDHALPRRRATVLIALGWIFLLLFLGTGVAGGETGSGGSTPDAGSLDTVVVSNVGQGFSVTSEGSLDPSALASVYPDPAAVTRALSGVAGVVGTYQRSWRTSTSADQVQDLVLRFSSAHAAAAFLRTAPGALATGPIVGTSHVAAVPGARRLAWFGSDGPAGAGGVGEAFSSCGPASLTRGVALVLLCLHRQSPTDCTDQRRPDHAGAVRGDGGCAGRSGGRHDRAAGVGDQRGGRRVVRAGGRRARRGGGDTVGPAAWPSDDARDVVARSTFR